MFPYSNVATFPRSCIVGAMSNASALALVPETEDTTDTDTDTAPKSDRQQVSLARGLRDQVTAERNRIESALPERRRRSIDSYTDLAMRLGLRELAKVAPIVDTLTDLDI